MALSQGRGRPLPHAEGTYSTKIIRTRSGSKTANSFVPQGSSLTAALLESLPILHRKSQLPGAYLDDARDQAQTFLTPLGGKEELPKVADILGSE